MTGPICPPNVCAVYTEESHRGQGIAGNLLNMAVEDLRSKGISTAYLVTGHSGFYERYGWEFLCMVHGDGLTEPHINFAPWEQNENRVLFERTKQKGRLTPPFLFSKLPCVSASAAQVLHRFPAAEPFRYRLRPGRV